MRGLFGLYADNSVKVHINLGGVDQRHIAVNSPLHWHRLDNPKQWQLALQDVLINGKPQHLCEFRPNRVCPAVIDPSVKFFAAPRDELGQLLHSVQDMRAHHFLGTPPEIVLRLVDRDNHLVDYPIHVKATDAGQDCPNPFKLLTHWWHTEPVAEEPAGRLDLELSNRSDGSLSIGKAFLQRFYAIFDDDNKQVGLVRGHHDYEVDPPVDQLGQGHHAESLGSS